MTVSSSVLQVLDVMHFMQTRKRWDSSEQLRQVSARLSAPLHDLIDKACAAFRQHSSARLTLCLVL